MAIPATNVAVEYDVQKVQIPGVSWHACRFTMSPASRGYQDLLPDLRQGVLDSARLLVNASVDQIIVGLSAETFSAGFGAAATIEELRRDLGDTALILGEDAIKRALESLGAKTIAVLTPYRDEGNALVKRFFDALGYKVKQLSSVPGLSPADVGDTPKRAVFEAVATMDAKEIDVVCQIGTGLSITDLIPMLESRLGKPVIASNLAHAWYALRTAGIRDRVAGLGILLAKH